MNKMQSAKSDESSRLNGLSLLRAKALVLELKNKAEQPDEVRKIAGELEKSIGEANQFIAALTDAATSLNMVNNEW